MLRCLLVAVAVAAAANLSAPAADPDLNGNWLISYTTRGGASEINFAIVKIENKDGKPSATVVATPGKGAPVSVKEFKVSGKAITVGLSNGPSFVGTVGSDPKQIVGGFGNDQVQFRGKMVRTDKDAIEAQVTKGNPPELMTRAQMLTATKDTENKLPGVYREVIAKHAAEPIAIDAAVALLQLPRANLTADEAGKLVALIEKLSAPYGERYTRLHVTPVLGAYKEILEKAGKTDEAKAVGARLAKIEAQLDAEYMTKMTIKPAPFAGRKDKSANKVAVLELFTGAQCPPCVAADIAFDALTKSYKPTDLVLIQYHMHIPGPDPMTNPDTTARWGYYQKLFAADMRGVPSSVFNGKPAAGGGGPVAAAEGRYKLYTGIIDSALEQTTPVKVVGKATRSADKVDITVEVNGAEGEDLKLRLLLVEDEVRFAGGNGIRFHHHVVRAMPGGAAGVALKDKSLRHTASADVGEVRKGLEKYLTDYAANTRPFPQPGRPMEMKHLKVIALVQSDKTGDILQAAQFDVEGHTASR